MSLEKHSEASLGSLPGHCPRCTVSYCHVGGFQTRSGLGFHDHGNGMHDDGRNFSRADVLVYFPQGCWPKMNFKRHNFGASVTADHQVLVFGGQTWKSTRICEVREEVECYRIDIGKREFQSVAIFKPNMDKVQWQELAYGRTFWISKI